MLQRGVTACTAAAGGRQLVVSTMVKTRYAGPTASASSSSSSPSNTPQPHSTHSSGGGVSGWARSTYIQPQSVSLLASRRYYASSKGVTTLDPSQDIFTPPDISTYKRTPSSSSLTTNEAQEQDEIANRSYTYMLIGGYSVLGVAAAKNIVTDYIVNLAASADVLALAKVEVDMTAIPEGKNVVLKWRGKPIVVRHRTADEIQEANTVNMAELRHPETDADRTKKPEWLVMLAVCTHLGCVPIGEAGDYGGWFCPCHGSHYDISGRIRKGPAPLNLELPPYEFTEGDTKIVIG